jgi:hypothetical protein
MYKGIAGTFLVLVIFVGGKAHAQEGVNVEERVREYFVDMPVMIEIARCESKFRQYTDSGNPFYGGAGGAMVGVFQVYTTVHAAYAKNTLNYDITTLEGNLGYAKYLYQTEGTQPWMSSFPCWGSTSSAETSSDSTPIASGGALSANLSFGMVHPEILKLQKMLNEKGFMIATEGPGSRGQETEKFGFLTRDAVRKFQCAQMQVCSGDEYSTGYGFVGAKTRTALASANTAPIATSQQSFVGNTTSSSYTTEQQEQIAQLQAQIVELTKVLADLIAKRQS